MNRYGRQLRRGFVRMGLLEEPQLGWVATFVMGVGIGFAVGAGAALLTTPYTGRESRERLQSGARKLADKTSEAIGTVRAQVTNKLSAGPAGNEPYRGNVPIG